VCIYIFSTDKNIGYDQENDAFVYNIQCRVNSFWNSHFSHTTFLSMGMYIITHERIMA